MGQHSMNAENKFLHSEEKQHGISGSRVSIREFIPEDASGNLNHEEWFHGVMNSISCLVWMAGPDGALNFFNRCWLAFTGEEQAEELKKSWAQRIHPEDIQRFRHVYDAMIKKRTGGQIELRLRHANGAYHWVFMVVTLRHDNAGRFVGFTATGVDVTDRKQLESDLSKVQIKAEEAQAQKREFLSVISHELRTPLNAVIGYSEMLASSYAGPLNERQRKYVQNVIISGRHLLDLVNDLLDITRIETGHVVLVPEEIEWASFIQDIQTRIEPMVKEKNIELTFILEPGLFFIEADLLRLRQIYMNLLSNAVKFNHRGGKVEVRIQTALNGQHVVCMVQDTGIGIPPEKLEELFHPFVQVDSSYARLTDGTGLGLALTRRLIRLHGGDIQVESNVGEGSIFTFTLPRRFVSFSLSQKD